MKKRFLSLLLTVLLLASCLPMAASAVDGTAYYGGAPAGGNYTISTADQLKALAETVNNGQSYASTTFTMIQDIDLSAVCSQESDISWPRIGYFFEETVYGEEGEVSFVNEFNPFSGAFDGSNYKITGLYIKLTESAERAVDVYDSQGLFGYIDEGGTVKNLGVTGSITGFSDVGGIVGRNSGIVENCSYIGDVFGFGEVGGIVGENDGGAVQNCYNAGTVNGNYNIGGVVGHSDRYKGRTCIVSNCYNTGDVIGDSHVGGVVGYSDYGSIEKCHNLGTVNGSGECVGGVAGETYVAGTMIDCFNRGTVIGGSDVGGIVGSNVDSVTNCYNTGDVTGDHKVGGVMGVAVSNSERCYNTGTVTGSSSVGGVVGQNFNLTIYDCYNTGDVTGEVEVGGVVGENYFGTLYDCYNIGKVSGAESAVGGIVGSNVNSKTYEYPFNCYYLENTALGGISGEDGTGKAEKLTVAEFKLISSFQNWDFANTWKMDTDKGRPALIAIPEGEDVPGGSTGGNSGGGDGTTAQIKKLYPANGATGVGYKANAPEHYQITFDREIVNDGALADVNLTSDGAFSIYRASDDALIYKPSQYASHDYNIVYQSENILSITPTNNSILLDPGTEYYITMGEGFVNFKDGSTNQAITKGGWVFTTEEYIPILYGSDFEMGIDSFGFNNFVSDYGDNAYSISDEYYRILLSKLSPLDALRVDCLQLKDNWSSFGGECFGASSVMALMYNSTLSPSMFQTNARTAFELDAPKDNKKVASLIYYYHLLQCISQFKEEDVGKTQGEMGQELVDSLLKTSLPIIVNFEYEEGNHAILAFSIDKDSDENDYIIYAADPNSLKMIDGSGKANKATVLRIDKKTYEINSCIFFSNASDNFFPYVSPSFISVLSSLTIYDDYNLQGALKGKSISNQILQYTIVETSAPSFIIEANGKQAAISNGNIGEGDLAIYKTYSNISNTNDGTLDNRYAFCVEVADSYKIVYQDANIDNSTELSFAASTGRYCRIESSANEVVVDANGLVEFSGAEGDSEVTISTDNSWYGLTIACSADNLTITPESESYTISSESSLGNVKVVGKLYWNDVIVSEEIADTSVRVLEVTDADDVTYLTLVNNKNITLGSSPVTYSVTYFSQGGSFVDAVSNIAYGSTISAPNAPTYDGYVFGGWYKDSNCSSEQEWDFESEVVTEDIILYAKWVPYTPGDSSGSDSDYTEESDVPGTNSFIDVPSNEYYYNAVQWAAQNGIVAGTSDTTFSPDQNSTRAQIVTFLWRAAGRPEPATTVNPFTDVKASEYYCDAVLWAYENNIVAGTSTTTFSPDSRCTRAQIVSFLWRAAKRPEPKTTVSPFTDAKASEYYYDAVLWAYENQIVAGTSATTFSPEQSCTRAQAVTFLYRNLAE